MDEETLECDVDVEEDDVVMAVELELDVEDDVGDDVVLDDDDEPITDVTMHSGSTGKHDVAEGDVLAEDAVALDDVVGRGADAVDGIGEGPSLVVRVCRFNV